MELERYLERARELDLTRPECDPLAEYAERLTGRLAVCGIGFLGRVEGRAYTGYGKWAWVGVSLHGKPWSSTRPRFLDARDEALLLPLFQGLSSRGQVSAGMPPVGVPFSARAEDGVG